MGIHGAEVEGGGVPVLASRHTGLAVRVRGVTLLLTVGGLLAVGASLAPSARADDPPSWSSLLPGLTWQYVPSSANVCQAGKVRCVDSVLREMDRRLDR